MQNPQIFCGYLSERRSSVVTVGKSIIEKNKEKYHEKDNFTCIGFSIGSDYCEFGSRGHMDAESRHAYGKILFLHECGKR